MLCVDSQDANGSVSVWDVLAKYLYYQKVITIFQLFLLHFVLPIEMKKKKKKRKESNLCWHNSFIANYESLLWLEMLSRCFFCEYINGMAMK